jgi:hypothetical protein
VDAHSHWSLIGRIGTLNLRDMLGEMGFDGIAYNEEGVQTYGAFSPYQVKSATGNNENFDDRSGDIRFNRRSTLSGYTQVATDKLGELFSHPGKLTLWDKTVGSMYHLAERSAPFKRVFTTAQNFINDVSFYANEAANAAPRILPRMDRLADLKKAPVSSADNKAIAAPILQGTLSWGRDEDSVAVRIEELQARYEALPAPQRARTPAPVAGVVWSDAELRRLFQLTGESQGVGSAASQIGLYREFRAATDKSLDKLGQSDLLRYGGKDVEPLRDMVMQAQDAREAAKLLHDYLMSLAGADPERAACRRRSTA